MSDDSDAHGRETVAAGLYGRRNSARHRGPGICSIRTVSTPPLAKDSTSARVSGHGGPSTGPSASSRADATTSSVPRGATSRPTF